MTYENSSSTDHLIEAATIDCEAQSAQARMFTEVYPNQTPKEGGTIESTCLSKFALNKSHEEPEVSLNSQSKNDEFIRFDGPSSLKFIQDLNYKADRSDR